MSPEFPLSPWESQWGGFRVGLEPQNDLGEQRGSHPPTLLLGLGDLKTCVFGMVAHDQPDQKSCEISTKIDKRLCINNQVGLV